MRRWTERKNILCGLGAVLGFALLFALTFHSRARTGQRAVELVAFGDSVFTDIGDMWKQNRKHSVITGKKKIKTFGNCREGLQIHFS